MITANAVRAASFDKSLHGYRCDDVDEYLKQVADALEQVSAKEEDLERKTQAMTEQLQRYSREEETLKTALLNAQRMGENVVREAQNKADAIVREAKIKADTIQQEVDTRTRDGENALRRLQIEVAHFKREVLNLYSQHVQSLSALPDLNADGEPVQPADASAAAQEIFAPGKAAAPVAVPAQTDAMPQSTAQPQQGAAPVAQNSGAVQRPQPVRPLSVNIFEDKLERKAAEEAQAADDEFPFLAAKPRRSALYDQDDDLPLHDGPVAEDAVGVKDIAGGVAKPSDIFSAPALQDAPAARKEDCQPEPTQDANRRYKPLTFGQTTFVPVEDAQNKEQASPADTQDPFGGEF